MKQAVNPYLPSWEYIPDAEPYVFGDRVYVYGSHDKFNGHVYCLNDYVCYSAPVDDLADWRYEGVDIPIGSKEPITFTLDHFTGARFGLFLFSEAISGGRAVFKAFNYERIE